MQTVTKNIKKNIIFAPNLGTILYFKRYILHNRLLYTLVLTQIRNYTSYLT